MVRENRETNVSDDIAGVLVRNRDRITDTVDVLARYGFARLADDAGAAAAPDVAPPLLLILWIRILRS